MGGVTRASKPHPAGLKDPEDPSFPFLATTRIPRLSSPSLAPRNSIWRRQKLCLGKIGQPSSHCPLPFLASRGLSISQTGGLRKQAGLFRAPEPRRQGPCAHVACFLEAWPVASAVPEPP